MFGKNKWTNIIQEYEIMFGWLKIICLILNSLFYEFQIIHMIITPFVDYLPDRIT